MQLSGHSKTGPSAGASQVLIPTVILLAVLAALAASLPGRHLYLELVDRDSGKVVFRRAVTDGERFTMYFRHSVERTPVFETYQVRGTRLRLLETVFYSFGAGLPTDASDAERLIVEDGRLRIIGFKREFERVLYAVGTVSDHRLIFGGDPESPKGLEVRLAAVARPGQGVWLRIVRRSLLREMGEEARAWLKIKT